MLHASTHVHGASMCSANVPVWGKGNACRAGLLVHHGKGLSVRITREPAMTPETYLSTAQDAAELLGVCDMLAQKGKYQKASDLLYSVAISDPHNEELKARWKDLIAKSNNQNVEINRAAAEKERADNVALEAKLAGGQAALSETKRWAGLKQQVSCDLPPPRLPLEAR